MAIDTREKRQSVAWLVTGLGAPSVTPNASKDQEWRQQAGWGYSGIAVDEPEDVIYVTASALTLSHTAPAIDVLRHDPAEVKQLTHEAPDIPTLRS